MIRSSSGVELFDAFVRAWRSSTPSVRFPLFNIPPPGLDPGTHGHVERSP